MEPDFLSTAEPCIHHLLIQGVAEVVPSGQGPIGPLLSLASFDDLPALGELLTPFLHCFCFQLAARRHLCCREAQTTNTRHPQHLLRLDTYPLDLPADQLLQVLRDRPLKGRQVPPHHPVLSRLHYDPLLNQRLYTSRQKQ